MPGYIPNQTFAHKGLTKAYGFTLDGTKIQSTVEQIFSEINDECLNMAEEYWYLTEKQRDEAYAELANGCDIHC